MFGYRGLFDRKMLKIFVLFVIINILTGMYNLNNYIHERDYLLSILTTIAYSTEDDDIVIIKKITDWVHHNSKQKIREFNCPVWKLTCWEHYNPLWNILKAPPIEIVNKGGACGNLTRLSVNMLELAGFAANRWHLWFDLKKIKNWENATGKNAENQYGHPIVEVTLSDKKIVIDPVYNIVYPYSIQSLKNNPQLIWEYTPDDYDWLYTYEEPRGIRWNIIGITGDKLYNLLSKIFGKNVIDNIKYPYFMDRPYLFLSYFHFILAVLFMLLIYLRNLIIMRKVKIIKNV